MNEFMSALNEMSFLKLANEILEKREFCNLNEEVGEKEKVIDQANDLEKSFYTARDKLIDEIEKSNKILAEHENRPDLSEAQKNELIELSILEKIKLKAGIDLLNKFFWSSINYRLPLANKNWDSLGIRKNWQIVGFDVNNEEAVNSVTNKAEKCIIAQSDVIVTNLLNEVYFKSKIIIEPDEPLTENETVIGELNAYEKCIFNVFHINRIKLNEIASKMKTGEHINIQEAELFSRLGDIYDKMLWTSLFFRFIGKTGNFNNKLGIRKNWKVVSFHEDKKD